MKLIKACELPWTGAFVAGVIKVIRQDVACLSADSGQGSPPPMYDSSTVAKCDHFTIPNTTRTPG